MGKVWIVEGSQWDTSWIESVHDSEEKAKVKVDALKSSKDKSVYSDYSYSDYEVE